MPAKKKETDEHETAQQCAECARLAEEVASLKTELQMAGGELKKAHHELTLEKAKNQAAAAATPSPGQPANPTFAPHWCSLIPDDDTNDLRPPMDPLAGWDTPEMLAWGERQKAHRHPKGGE